MKENKLLELKNMLDSEGIPYTYECKDWIRSDGKIGFTSYSIWYPKSPKSLVHIHTSTKLADKGCLIGHLRRKNELYDFLRKKRFTYYDEFNDELFLLIDPASAFEIIKKHHNKELGD